MGDRQAVLHYSKITEVNLRNRKVNWLRQYHKTNYKESREHNSNLSQCFQSSVENVSKGLFPNLAVIFYNLIPQGELYILNSFSYVSLHHITHTHTHNEATIRDHQDKWKVLFVVQCHMPFHENTWKLNSSPHSGHRWWTNELIPSVSSLMHKWVYCCYLQNISKSSTVPSSKGRP